MGEVRRQQYVGRMEHTTACAPATMTERRARKNYLTPILVGVVAVVLLGLALFFTGHLLGWW
jgi:hypothetical protein